MVDATDKYFMFVYVIASGPNTVKIGYSSDPQRRLKELQTGHERKLTLVHKETVTESEAPYIEKIVHVANRHKCLHGEWFNLTHEQAIHEIQFAIIRYSDNFHQKDTHDVV
jgi:predicted GIY-YIG superfamily endonuclease